MNWRNRIPKIYIFWIIELFDLKKDIEENLGIKPNTLYIQLYRNAGHKKDSIDKVINFVRTRIEFDISKAYKLMFKEDFLDTIKL